MRVPKRILFVKERTFDVPNWALYSEEENHTFPTHTNVEKALILNKEFAKIYV